MSVAFGGVQALRDATIDFFSGEVHCLAGENGCGKSTLIKVISGVYRPDSGQVTVKGTTMDHLSPKDARGLGIEVIYQDFSLLPNLSAAENIALPRLNLEGARLASRQRAGVEIDLTRPVGDLTVADRQLCAVARALAQDSSFLAMDEPTTALTWREVDKLFEAVNVLRDSGVAIAFVSHKLQEVFAMADRVSVMRNGTIVASGQPSEYTHESLTEGMTGRSTGSFTRTSATWTDKAAALEVTNLTHVPLYADVSFSVGQGEIVGLSGLLGSGRTEIAEAIAGLRPPTAGSVKVRGDDADVRSVQAAVNSGISYVPEDRLTQGLFLDQPIGDNMTAGSIDGSRSRGFLNIAALVRACRETVSNLRIKLGSLRDPVSSLSGGNAQRVLIGKWLLTEPHLPARMACWSCPISPANAPRFMAPWRAGP